MRLLRDMNIKSKIMGIAFVGVIGIAAYLGMNFQVTQTNSERLGSIRNIYYPTLERLDTSIVYLVRIKEIWTSAVVTADEDLAEDAQVLLEKKIKIYQEISSINPETTKTVEKLSQVFKNYFNTAKKLSLGMIRETLEPEETKELSKKLAIDFGVYERDLKTFRQFEYDHFNAILKHADEASRNNLWWGLMISVATLIIICGTALAISNAISGGINKVRLAMVQLSEGNLTTHLDYPNNDEIGQLIEYHNSSLSKLRLLIDGIIQRANQLIATSDELLTAMTKTDESANKQKNESEQLATAIAEMTASISEVALNTTEVVSATNEADAKSKEGHTVMTATSQSIQRLAQEVELATETINSLEEDSKNIGTVLAEIKGIAEQTNLLALNAAIEAARAGEQGRGFAVVADEVRTLASRTQQSTQEIQRTIEKLQLGAQKAADVMVKGRTQAHASVEQSDSAGVLLNTVTSSMCAVSELNCQIAVAADEQTAVANEIHKNIVIINDLAHQTSSYAKESTETAVAVETLSMQLKDLVLQFKVS